jgi:hypothetical protein
LKKKSGPIDFLPINPKLTTNSRAFNTQKKYLFTFLFTFSGHFNPYQPYIQLIASPTQKIIQPAAYP